MKNTQTIVAKPVRVQLNTTRKASNQWARIICERTGKTLHTGQPKYIKRLAAKRFNLDLLID
jgi:hypothetical protein